MLRAMWWEVFHSLWGKNKELVYDKEKWMELQRQLEELEADLQLLSMADLLQKYLGRKYEMEGQARQAGNDLEEFTAIASKLEEMLHASQVIRYPKTIFIP